MPAIDQSGMRRTNRRTTLRALASRDGIVTTADLVEDTGLSRRTIELIVADLTTDGWVIEVSAPGPARNPGRPRRYFEFVPEHAVVLSIHFAAKSAVAWVADLRGRVIGRGTADAAAEGPADLCASAIEAGRMALAEAGAAHDALRAVSVALAGTVDSEGCITSSPLSGGWIGVDIATPIRDAFGVPVLVENDTNLSALAEYASGAAQDTPSFLLFVPGNRIAAGIVIDGEVYRGADGSAGELIRIPSPNLRVRREHPFAMLTSVSPEESARARALLQRAHEGDAEAARLADEFFEGTAQLIAAIGWILAPPVIVLAGAYYDSRALVLHWMQRALSRLDTPAMELRMASHGEDASLRGGLQRALSAVTAELYDSPR
jgi:predicted NBD/HSP70 family sugar kinase